MNDEQQRREEDEGELDRLGDAGEERRQSEAEEKAADRLASLGERVAVHRQAGCRKPEHHHRKEAGHEASCGRIAGEEALEVAGCTVKIAQDEPGNIIYDVVQTRDQQQPVEQAVKEQAERTGTHHPLAERIDPAFEPWEAEAEQCCTDDSREARGDGHKPATGKEREIVRKLDVREAVVKQSGDDPGQDSGGNAELRNLLGAPGGLFDIRRSNDVRRKFEQHLRAFGRNDISDHARERGGPVIFARETDCDAGCEQQAEVGEDGVARSCDERNVEHVRLAEAKQKRGDRQHCDWQHQRPAERLEAVDPQLHASASAAIVQTS